MPDDPRELLPILLGGWVLGDGNYDDYVAGTRREFALEFHIAFDRPFRRVEGGVPGMRATGSYGDYEVTARVAYNNLEGDAHGREDACWVLDFGVLMAYSARPSHLASGAQPRVGDTLRGTLSLGVDPFFYFERLCNVPGVPPLIYSWIVETIEISATPQEVVHHGDPRFPPFIPPMEGPVLLPDLARERWRPLTQTRMSDVEVYGPGVYRLHCSKTASAPTRAFTTPQRTRA